jgi:hypothetical protein
MKYNNNIHQAKTIGLQNNVHHTNRLGLAKAYQSNKSTHIDGDTMYIAGTKGAKDWYGNFTKLPVGLTKNADRYSDAVDALRANPQVKNIVVHSLGSSVAVELTKQHPDKQLELKALYASPFIDFGSKTHGNRYRHRFDPISMLDGNSKTVDIGLVSPLKSHSYDNYE